VLKTTRPPNMISFGQTLSQRVRRSGISRFRTPIFSFPGLFTNPSALASAKAGASAKDVFSVAQTPQSALSRRSCLPAGRNKPAGRNADEPTWPPSRRSGALARRGGGRAGAVQNLSATQIFRGTHRDMGQLAVCHTKSSCAIRDLRRNSVLCRRKIQFSQ